MVKQMFAILRSSKESTDSNLIEQLEEENLNFCLIYKNLMIYVMKLISFCQSTTTF